MIEKSFSIVGNKKLLFAKFLALTCPQHINIKLNIFRFLTLHLYHPSKFDLDYTLKQTKMTAIQNVTLSPLSFFVNFLQPHAAVD